MTGKEDTAVDGDGDDGNTTLIYNILNCVHIIF